MYNQLPSTVLRDGSAFDIMVADVYATWEKARENPGDTENYKEEDLMEIMKSVRGAG